MTDCNKLSRSSHTSANIKSRRLPTGAWHTYLLPTGRRAAIQISRGSSSRSSLNLPREYFPEACDIDGKISFAAALVAHSTPGPTIRP